MLWTALLIFGVLLLAVAALLAFGAPAGLAVLGAGCIYAAVDATRTAEVSRG